MKLKKILILIILLAFLNACKEDFYSNNLANAYKRTEKNYEKDVEKYSEKFYLNKNFLKSLIILECNGVENPPARFEQGVYENLIRLKERKISKFEDLTPEIIKNTPDSIIRQMASSWGPFQIMGYKCVNLNIEISQLKGEDIFFYSVKWIDENYGDVIRNKEYKHAFHIHNSGKMYPDNGPPLTYDINYVANGIKYMKHFREQDSIRYYGKTNIKIKVKK